MKKRMSIFVLVIALFGIFFCLNLVSSDFVIGEEPYDYNISLIYAPSQAINGWINISLDDEPANSLLTGFEDSIFLEEFLEKNNAVYSCFPNDCESTYSSSEVGVDLKTFSLDALKTKTLGIKLIGEITGVNTLSFDFETNAGKSCLHPVQIDVLDDGLFEWKAEDVSEDFTCILSNNYGCWDENDCEGEKSLITDSLYCETISLLPPLKTFEIGAEVLEVSGKGGNVDFKMELDSYNCIANAQSSGEIKCSITFDEPLENSIDAQVCISVKDSSDNGKYEIKYEEVSPCGSAGEKSYDFPIFVNPGKYSRVLDFAFNQDLVDENGIDLGSEIFDYIEEKYSGNCEPECIIPIKIYAGISQTDTISNLRLEYQSGVSLEETKIHNIEETSALLSSDFIKLYLEKGNFLTPEDYGDEGFSLKLNGERVFSQDIEIKPISEIKDIIPHILPALVEVTFTTLLEDSGANLTYTWDFGDGSEEEITEINTIKHTYSDVGAYEINVRVSNEFGESSKIVLLEVVSPKDIINSTIDEYEINLINIESQINGLPEWITKEIAEDIDVDDLKLQLKLQKNKYEDCGGGCSSKEYVNIMSSLLELKIPYQVNTSHKIVPMEFYPDKSQLDFEILEELGVGIAGNLEETYHSAINNWIRESLDISLESKTYALYFKNSQIEPLFSYVKLTLKPKKDLGEVYCVINENPINIKFNNLEGKEVGDVAVGIVFSELTENKVIEFLYPGKIEIQNLPIYISPEFRELEIISANGICNNNGKCEKDIGENSKNCRVDCRPLGWTFFLFFILIFVAFFIYIFLQEWYKRRYRAHLFKSKNQFFNLINFMSNSVNQGLKRSEVFGKLKNVGWINEQLVYSWKKLHGKRTGMWEIPIFKFVEKKQIKKELSKRSNKPSLAGLSLNPKPI